MKNKVKVSLILSVLAALTVTFGIGYRNVNRAYAETALNSVPEGEALSFNDSVTIKVEDSEYMPQNWKSDQINPNGQGDYRVIHAHLLFANMGSSEETVDLSEFYMSTTGYSQGVSLEFLSSGDSTGTSGINITIPVGGEAESDLYYVIHSISFTDAQWKSIEKEKFWISCSEYYPERQRLELYL